MRVVGSTVVFDFHELAWSARTTGRPVYALTLEGLVPIGRTQKGRCVFRLPSGTVGVVVPYTTNRGYRVLWYYDLSGNLRKYDEKFNYDGAVGEPYRALQLLGWVEG